ncbi:mitochondrial 50S ribosomal protein L28-like protein, partial [Vararia minispora EC-137]
MFPSLPSLAQTAQVLSQPFKRAQWGLYHGKMIQFGNNVPFSKKKTRRTWLPNVQVKHFFSDALRKWVRVKLTSTALRTINKYGGSLDKYVLTTRPDLLGHRGMQIRLRVRDALARREAAA